MLNRNVSEQICAVKGSCHSHTQYAHGIERYSLKQLVFSKNNVPVALDRPQTSLSAVFIGTTFYRRNSPSRETVNCVKPSAMSLPFPYNIFIPGTPPKNPKFTVCLLVVRKLMNQDYFKKFALHLCTIWSIALVQVGRWCRAQRFIRASPSLAHSLAVWLPADYYPPIISPLVMTLLIQLPQLLPPPTPPTYVLSFGIVDLKLL